MLEYGRPPPGLESLAEGSMDGWMDLRLHSNKMGLCCVGDSHNLRGSSGSWVGLPISDFIAGIESARFHCQKMLRWFSARKKRVILTGGGGTALDFGVLFHGLDIFMPRGFRVRNITTCGLHIKEQAAKRECAVSFVPLSTPTIGYPHLA